jgi:hypothetical protein
LPHVMYARALRLVIGNDCSSWMLRRHSGLGKPSSGG